MFIAAVPLFQGTIEIAVIGILFGLAVSVSTVATSTYVADVAKQENIGASLGALSSIMDIGHSSGPFIAGVVITATTMAGGFLIAGARLRPFRHAVCRVRAQENRDTVPKLAHARLK